MIIHVLSNVHTLSKSNMICRLNIIQMIKDTNMSLNSQLNFLKKKKKKTTIILCFNFD